MDLSAFTFEVLQPNPTVARVMRTALEGVGAQVQPSSDGDSPPADGLLVDVQLLDQHPGCVERYTQRGRPVLVCGFSQDRARWGHQGDWLARPFSPRALIFACARMVGAAPALGEVDAPQLGGARADLIEDASSLIVDIEEISAVEEIELIEETTGHLIGSVQMTTLQHGASLSEGTLADARSEAEPDTTSLVSDDTTSPEQHMFEPPRGHLALREDADMTVTRPEQHSFEIAGIEAVTSLPDITRVSSEMSEVSEPSMPGAHGKRAPSRQLHPQQRLELTAFARMLAEAWPRMGLAARVEDRADRLTRVITAMLEQGIDAASDVLQRIPGASGFSGTLDTLSLVGLFRTVRDRRLRGRLELSSQGQGFVLYLERNLLVGIEALDGDEGGALLRILHAQGVLSTTVMRELLAEYSRADHLSAPVEMMLRQRLRIAPQTIASARAVHARELFERVCAIRQGYFSFISIQEGSHYAWPGRQLNLNIDELVLELLREVDLPLEHSRATSGVNLMPDPERVAQLSPEQLTPEELELLRFFNQGGTLAEARRRMPHGDEEVERIVNRLKRAELLKRSDPMHRALRSDTPANLQSIPGEPMPQSRRDDPRMNSQTVRMDAVDVGFPGERGQGRRAPAGLRPSGEEERWGPDERTYQMSALQLPEELRAELDATLALNLDEHPPRPLARIPRPEPPRSEPLFERHAVTAHAPPAGSGDSAVFTSPLDDALERLERDLGESSNADAFVEDEDQMTIERPAPRSPFSARGFQNLFAEQTVDEGVDELERLLREAVDEDRES